MTWKIIGPHHHETTIDALRAEYPDIVAYDDSGLEVDLNDFPKLTHTQRILFWRCAAEAENDPGTHAIAEGVLRRD